MSINTGIEWTEVKVRNSVTHLIFAAAAGTPSGASSGICRSCGLPGTGASFSTWVRSTFTDFDKLTSGEIVCAACLFCFVDANPVLDARLGKPRQLGGLAEDDLLQRLIRQVPSIERSDRANMSMLGRRLLPAGACLEPEDLRGDVPIAC